MKTTEPLFLPKGSIRALLALAIVLSGVWELINEGGLTEQHFLLVVGSLLFYGLMRADKDSGEYDNTSDVNFVNFSKSEEAVIKKVAEIVTEIGNEKPSDDAFSNALDGKT
jgi:hypothetical protein